MKKEVLVSLKIRYKHGVKHWLVVEFGWLPEKARVWVRDNVEYLELKRAESLSTYATARLIAEMKKEN